MALQKLHTRAAAIALALTIGVLWCEKSGNAELIIMHDFDIETGSGPHGDLIEYGDLLFGMASRGGAHNDGVIFQIGTDGSSFAILHDFEGPADFEGYADDGEQPFGSLIGYGDLLFGMTSLGGAYGNAGVIFQIGTDGSDFSVLHDFEFGDPENGATGYASLIARGDILFGMTRSGGAHDAGVIFQIGTDGSDFAVLHDFESGVGDNGAFPGGSLILLMHMAPGARHVDDMGSACGYDVRVLYA